MIHNNKSYADNNIYNEWFNEKKKSSGTELHKFLDAANLQAVTSVIEVHRVQVTVRVVEIQMRTVGATIASR